MNEVVDIVANETNINEIMFMQKIRWEEKETKIIDLAYSWIQMEVYQYSFSISLQTNKVWHSLKGFTNC